VLGKERYLRFVEAQEGRKIDLAEFKREADADLERNKTAYQALVAKVKVTRPTAAELLPAATKVTEDARRFVLDQKLVSFPSDERCTVKETPPFQRWNSAFLNSAGPFDTAKDAYYYITLPDPK